MAAIPDNSDELAHPSWPFFLILEKFTGHVNE
jgi:hypothetical protein